MIDQAKVENTTVRKNTNRFIIHNIIELFLSAWYWIVVSMVICFVGAWLYLKMSPDTYSIAATMQINSPSTPMNQDVMKAFRSPSTAEKEIHFFKSHQVIQDVIEDLNLTVTYIKPHLFLDEDMYDKTPVDIRFIDNSYPACSFNIECRTDSYTISTIETEKGKTAMVWNGKYGDTLITPKGVIVVKRRDGFANIENEKMRINYRPLNEATGYYMGRMNAAIIDEDAGNIRLSMNDINLKRGIDIINLWIESYNRHTVEYKNRVAENTARFIEERLKVISVELSDVEGDLEEYMREHNISDMNTEMGSNISSRTQYSQALVDDEVAARVARDLSNKVREAAPYTILPNIALGDNSVNALIEEYNKRVRERQVLLANSSSSNPIVAERESQMETMRATILRSIENYIQSIQIRIREYRNQTYRTTSAINMVPTQRREMQSFTRQQSIKEQLYLYLLNKREENALKLTITEADTRVIDYAAGWKISPVPSHAYSMAFIIALLIPIGVILLIKFLDVRIRSK
ncbi:MAG: hypothetical protein IKJ40_04620, partial [Bacteroidales bacterium]|nr:hypothetical protein [Bacteroidales bacterium]